MPQDVRYELSRTKPDYIVYVPGSLDGSSGDTGNEHFHAFDGPDGSLMVVWTQSTMECQPDQRVVFSRSTDEGLIWSKPKLIAGPDCPCGTKMASWQFAMVSNSGRLYVLFNRHIGVDDIFAHTTGVMSGTYSDDCGETWADIEDVPMARNLYDNPDPAIPTNWIIWQKPERLSRGKYLAGFTQWLSPIVSETPKSESSWMYCESVVSFMRFENIDDDPAVADIQITRLADGEDALRNTTDKYPDLTVVQEPSLVELPGGRLFCTLRTRAGYPAWSVSADAGDTWSEPRPMKYSDDGEVMEHPLSPCPIYRLTDGTYIFLYHNHPGMSQPPFADAPAGYERTPICVAHGRYRLGADQPIWFSEPKVIMDSEFVALGYEGGRSDLAMYASLTRRNGRDVLWYPDRKFYLLGRKVNGSMFPALS